MCRHNNTRELSETCFQGPVAYDDEENPAAHGNITITDECTACGALRRVNVNGNHVEWGQWFYEED